MATKSTQLRSEIKHWDQFKQYLAEFQLHPQQLEIMAREGMLQVSTVYEHATADVIGCEVVSEDGHDLSNGKENKMCTCRFFGGTRPQYGALVSNVNNKTGDICVQALEEQTHKFYYFVIPYRAYCHLKCDFNIGFSLDGEPERHRTYWEYEVLNFVEHALLSGDQAQMVNKLRSILADSRFAGFQHETAERQLQQILADSGVTAYYERAAAGAEKGFAGLKIWARKNFSKYLNFKALLNQVV